MKIFWTKKAYEDEIALLKAKYNYRDAVLALIESAYDMDFRGKNGDEVMDMLQAHDDKIHWEWYERGTDAGIRAAFRGMCNSGIMKKETAEKFIKRITAHTHEEIESARAEVRAELEKKNGQE